MKLPTWFDSIRAWAVIIILAGLTGGLFTRIISPADYMQIALIVITAYFSKRDAGEENSRITPEK